jgi:hypothetical protein
MTTTSHQPLDWIKLLLLPAAGALVTYGGLVTRLELNTVRQDQFTRLETKVDAMVSAQQRTDATLRLLMCRIEPRQLECDALNRAAMVPHGSSPSLTRP